MLTYKALQYCIRGIIRYLNGDMELFHNYIYKAEKEQYITTIGELIDKDIKTKLYKMVS